MKKLFLIIALAWGTSLAIPADNTPKHRYQADTLGIEAYSDTTSVSNDSVQDEATEDYTWERRPSKYSPNGYDSPFDYIGEVFGAGFLGTFIFILVLLGFLFVLAPFIIIILIIRYLVKRHRDRVRLEEEAIRSGQYRPWGDTAVNETASGSNNPVNDGSKTASDELMVKRGIRNFFLGAGLGAMFAIWGWTPMVGISALVLIYGLGQCVIGLIPVIKKLYAEWHNQK